VDIAAGTTDDVRRKIIDAATELFVAEGYGNVSMRKIAREISYTPTTIYLYFKDKADLLDQICEQTFAQLTRNLIAINKLSVSPLEKLKLGLREYIQFGLHHPNHYAIVFNTSQPSEPKQSFEKSQGEAAFDTLRESVAACIADGSIENPDAELVSQTLWACVHGVTSLLITKQGFPFVERQVLTKSVVDTIINGLRR
jgi:AcrR family transcriptional regulator